MMQNQTARRLPEWFKVKVSTGGNFADVRTLLKEKKLNTVCQSAKCPNIWECWSKRTATFLILGDVCTRKCRFCAVTKGHPAAPDREEPARVAYAVKKLGIKHAVITSVTRDDLPDGGASIFAEVVHEIRKFGSGCTIELLTPDFSGNEESYNEIFASKPEIFNHNIETVSRLYKESRIGASYETSLDFLKKGHDAGLKTKSSLIIGMGETKSEIIETMKDMRDVSVNILTIGQYLAPSKANIPVQKFYTPQEFLELKEKAVSMGFSHVESGPLVRSSYHAGDYC